MRSDLPRAMKVFVPPLGRRHSLSNATKNEARPLLAIHGLAAFERPCSSKCSSQLLVGFADLLRVVLKNGRWGNSTTASPQTSPACPILKQQCSSA